ncbi:13112_t:CDS:2, partial [Acaulospora colombiana]
PFVLDIEEPISRYQQPFRPGPLSSPIILPFDIGTTIYNPKDGSAFQLIRPLGNGSYAVVYMALEKSTRKYYALKCLSKANLTDYQLDVQRNEVIVHERLRHPNIVKLDRYFETPDWLFLVLEYCEGQDLYYWLTQNNDSRDPETGRLLSETERMMLIKQVFLQILDAVGYCHSRGVAHRDLKPENFIIMINKDESDCSVRVKLTDFGLATEEIESTDFDCGSKPYMSYECRNPTHDTYDPRLADVWSLGIIFLNLIYHRSPWSDPNPEECKSFAAFNIDKPSFLIRRFASMPKKVAHFLAKRVFCNADEGRVSIKEWIYWCADMVERMLQEERDDSQDFDAVVPQQLLHIAPSSVPNKSSSGRNGHDRNDSWSEVFGEFDNEMDFTVPVLFADKHVATDSVGVKSSRFSTKSREEDKEKYDESSVDTIANNSDVDSGFGTDEDINTNVIKGARERGNGLDENASSSRTLVSTSPPKVIYCKPKPWGEHKVRGHQRKLSTDNGSNSASNNNNSHWTSYNQRRERLEQRRKDMSSNRRRGSYSLGEETSTPRPNMDYVSPRRQKPPRPSNTNHDKDFNHARQPVSKRELPSPPARNLKSSPSIYVPPMIGSPVQTKPSPDSTSQVTNTGQSIATSHRSRDHQKSYEKPPRKVARSTKNHLGKMLAGVVMFNRGVKVGGQNYDNV